MSAIVLIIGTLLAGAGLAWWVHPGAGLALVGLVMVIDAMAGSTRRAE